MMNLYNIKNLLEVILVVVNILLVFMILLHNGQGNGLSSMFGGYSSFNSLNSSSVAMRNLNRITVFLILIWLGIIICIGVIEKFLH